MTAPSNANTSGLEVVAWLTTGGDVTRSEAYAREQSVNDPDKYPSALVTAASAQARLSELEAENDVLKVEVIGLRAAIFGSHDYDPTLRHGNFIEMARATEDGRQGALARATAAEARIERVIGALKDIRAGGSWHGDTASDLLAALQQETQK